MALGSGLDVGKLIATLQEMLTSEPPPTLVCQSVSDEHAWAHIALSGWEDTAEAAWIITLGYPYSKPPQDVFQEVGLWNFLTWDVIEWRALTHLKIRSQEGLPAAVAAQAILAALTRIQIVQSDQSVELTLEYGE